MNDYPEFQTVETAVIGGGIAGYTAALTAKNLKLRYLWFGERDFGEKTLRAETVKNFPAFTGSGKAFSETLSAQRDKEGVVLTERRIDGIYPDGDGFLLTSGDTTYRTQTVILATGVSSGAISGERELLGRGVSYCAVCDGALYKGKEIAVVLGSARFAHEVNYLAGFAKTVHVFCAQEISFDLPNVTVHNGTPTAVEGKEKVERLITNDGGMSVDGVFFLRNSLPPATFLKGIQTDGEHVVCARDMSTSVKGVFAAGDITGRPYQFIKAAGEGLVAAFSVKEYLK